MQIDDKTKDIFGMAFFAVSILMLIYMLVSPLNQVIIHMDEYFTMTLTQLPIQDILTATTWDVHPPLYYLMAKAVAKLSSMFGLNLLFGLRILSIIPYGIILIISAIKIRKDYDWLTAGLFTLSLAVMSEFFTHFLIARMYGWAILFVILTFICAKEIITEEDKKYWILLAIFSILSAYTHYFALLSVACIYLILLFYIISNNKEELKNWAISAAASIILFIPWIFSFINQLTNVRSSFWVPEVNLNTIISSFGYFANGTDIIFSIIAILAILAIIAIYILTVRQNLDEKNQFYIITGIGVYIGTILLGIIISLVFKPILMVRYLLPAAGVLWLTISIIISKIEDKRMFLISFALIVLLLISGIATVFSSTDTLYQNGISQKEVLDNITQDNNSMVIVPSQNMIMYFLDYSNQTDMYCLNVGHVFGINMERLHKIFDFETYNGTEIDNLIANNTDKNIYIISWQDPVLNTTTVELDRENGIVFSKVNVNALNENQTY